MLLPSSIQRADDLVGMAMPTVGLPCASADPASAMEPSNMVHSIDRIRFMLHSHMLSFRHGVIAFALGRMIDHTFSFCKCREVFIGNAAKRQSTPTDRR